MLPHQHGVTLLHQRMTVTMGEGFWRESCSFSQGTLICQVLAVDKDGFNKLPSDLSGLPPRRRNMHIFSQLQK